MAQTIKIKRSATSGNKLTGSNSVAGEIGMNTADKALYIQTGSANGDVVTVAHESTLKIDEGNNRVGIGTINPGVELEIAGANPILRIRENDQTNKFGDILVNSNRIRIRSRAGSNNGSIAFEGNNGSTTTEYARFDASGNLGIGETTPSAPLHIGGDGRVAIFGDDSFDDKYIELREGGVTGFRMGLRTNLVDSSGCILLQTGDDKGFGIAVNTTADWGSVATSSIPFYVAEGGNVGIGTTAPSYPLHVNPSSGSATVYTESSGGYATFIANSATGAGAGLRLSKAGANTIRIESPPNSNDLTFQMLGVESARLTSDGDFGIGEASPDRRLHVKDSTLVVSKFESSNSGGVLIDLENAAVPASHAGAYAGIRFYNSSGFNMALSHITESTGNGYVQIGDSWDGSSTILKAHSSGAITFNDAFTFPTAIGSAGQVLKVPTSGTTLYWANEAAASAGTSIADADGDTKIQVEESADEDIIRFDTAGSQRMVVDSTGLTIGSATDTTTLVFPDKTGIPDNPTETNDKVQLIKMGQNGNGGMWQTTGRGGMLISSADDSLVLANGDVGRFYDPNGGGHHPAVANETFALLSDFDIRFTTGLQDGWSGGTNYSPKTSVITAEGRFGIGTTSPNRQLHIYGSGATVAAKIETSDGNQASVDIKNSEGEFRIISDSGELSIYDQTDTTERLRIDTAGFVGIGQIAPSAKLHVKDASFPQLKLEDADDTMEIGYSGTNFYFKRNDNDGSITFRRADNSDVMSVAMSTKRVGIGETTPSAVLHVTTDTDADGIIIQRNSTTAGTNAQLSLMPSTNSSGTPNLWIRGVRGATSYSENYMVFGTNSTERLRIDSAGNVGIGTTSPSQKLQVAGTILADTALAASSGNDAIGIGSESNIADTSSTYKTKLITDNNNAKLTTYQYGSYLTLKAGVEGSSYANNWSKIELRDGGGTGSNNAHMKFYTHGDERMVIDNDGKVGIGTTSPTSELQVGDGTTNATLRAYYSDNTYAEYAGYGVQFNRSVSYLRPTTNGDKRLEIGGSTLTWDKIINWADTSFLFSGGGNVGIGSTDPQAVLDLGNATQGRGIAWGGPSGTSHYNTIWSEYSTASIIIGAGLKGATGSATFLNPFTGTYGYAAIELDSFSDDGIKFYTGADAARTKDAAITPTEQMRLDNSGRLGIGTSSPAYQLDVAGTGRFTGAVTLDSTLAFSTTTAIDILNMSNNNIYNVNNIKFNDPGPSEGLQWTNTKIYESPDDLTTNSAGNLQLVYNNTRRLTVNNTGIDVNGTITGATNISKRAATTATGGTGTEDGANTWAKLATYSNTQNYSDATFVYSVVTEEQSSGSGGIIHVKVRWQDISSSTNPLVSVEWGSKNSGDLLGVDAFKLINDGPSSNVELWVQKDVSYGDVELWETAYNKEGAVTVTYETNSAWQSSTPTGTAINVTSSTLKFDGKEVIVGDNFVNSSNVKIEGVVEASSTGDAYIVINSDTDNSGEASSWLRFSDDDTTRWEWGKNSAGDIKLNRYNTSGVYQDQPITVSVAGLTTLKDQITRSAGVTRLLGTSGVEGLTVNADANIGIGTTSPTQYINTSSTYFRPDSSGKFLTINGGGNGSFIMLESTSNTNGDQIGGLYFTDGTGQSDAHRQVAGIDAIVAPHGTNNALSGADLRLFTKPIGGGASDPRMTIKSTGFVGINTNNPAYQLDLSSGTTNTAARFFSTDATTNIMLQDSSATTYFSTSDGNAYFGGSAGLSANNLTLVQSSGNVGIGDYTPNYKLHVNSGTTNVVATFESTDNEAWINLKDDVSGNYGCLIGFDSDNSNLFKIADSSVNTKFTLKSSGRVGIGTDSPTEMLEVYTNGSQSVVRIHEDAGSDVARLHLRTGGNDTHIQNDPSNGFEIRTENNLVSADPALKIQGSGNATFGYNVSIKELRIDTTETSTSATTQVAIDTMAAATFRSARYTIQVTNSTDSTYHLTEILLIHNGTTPQITEYGTIFTGSAEATFDADISSGNVRLLATPSTTDSMTFKVVRHCITV